MKSHASRSHRPAYGRVSSIAFALLLTLTGCQGTPDAEGDSRAASVDNVSAAHAQTADESNSGASEDTGSATTGHEEHGQEAHGHDHGFLGEPGDTFGHGPEIPLEVTLEPECVELGGTVELTVVTEPYAMVAYMAQYSDGGGGGPPPYGSGYGGNSGGIADVEGRYGDTWVVVAHAPTGDATVTVIAVATAAYDEPAERGTIVGFTVVEDSADC